MKKNHIIALTASVIIIGAAAGFMISAYSEQEAPANTTDILSNAPSLTVGDISATPIQSNPTQDTESAVNGHESEANESAVTNTDLTSLPSKPTSAPPPPTIEGAGGVDSNGNPIKATNPALLDKDNPPSYTSKPVIDGGSKPSPSSPGNNSKPSSNNNSKPTPSTPNAGDTKDGKTYVPGFGWVDGTGGEEVEYVEDMIPNGNKIGIME